MEWRSPSRAQLDFEHSGCPCPSAGLLYIPKAGRRRSEATYLKEPESFRISYSLNHCASRAARTARVPFRIVFAASDSHLFLRLRLPLRASAIASVIDLLTSATSFEVGCCGSSACNSLNRKPSLA